MVQVQQCKNLAMGTNVRCNNPPLFAFGISLHGIFMPQHWGSSFCSLGIHQKCCKSNAFSVVKKFQSASSDTIANNQVKEKWGVIKNYKILLWIGEEGELALIFPAGRQETTQNGNKKASGQYSSQHDSPTDLWPQLKYTSPYLHHLSVKHTQIKAYLWPKRRWGIWKKNQQMTIQWKQLCVLK